MPAARLRKSSLPIVQGVVVRKEVDKPGLRVRYEEAPAAITIQFPDGRRKSVSEQSDTTLQSRGKVDHHLVHHPEPEQAVNKRECVRTGLDKGDTVPFLFPSGKRDERYRFLKVPYRLLPDPGDTVFVRRILQRGEGLPLQQAAVKGEKGHKLNLCHKLNV